VPQIRSLFSASDSALWWARRFPECALSLFWAYRGRRRQAPFPSDPSNRLSCEEYLSRSTAVQTALRVGNLLTIFGLIFLVPAMVGVIFVITDLMFGLMGAVAVTVLMALVFGLLWFALPLWYRRNGG
jgi:hypothetical protein